MSGRDSIEQELRTEMEEPAAICDGALRVTAVNGAFSRFCADNGLTVEQMAESLAAMTPPPAQCR